MTPQTQSTITSGVRATKSTTTCARLLALADLEGLLSGEGRYTFFAPTDQAFEDLPPGLLQAVEDDPLRLRAMLEYHILSVRREIGELRNGKLQTVEGTLLTVFVTDDGLRIDHAHTRGSPVRCVNGVIHPIDAVLFPGFTPQVSATAQRESAWSGRSPARASTPAAPTAAQAAEALFEMPHGPGTEPPPAS